MVEIAVSGHSPVSSVTGPISVATNTLCMPGCAGQDLEGADHVEGGEPGVEQVGNQHASSVWPGPGTHKDTLLTIPATAPAAYRRPMDSR